MLLPGNSPEGRGCTYATHAVFKISTQTKDLVFLETPIRKVQSQMADYVVMEAASLEPLLSQQFLVGCKAN